MWWILAGFVLLLFFIIISRRTKYDYRGFDKNGTHRNGTKYDDAGYDAAGYDRNGYNHRGYDSDGYDRNGYNLSGYDRKGRNSKGQYNRLFDRDFRRDGFCSFQTNSIIVTNHARQRIMERMPMQKPEKAERLAYEAYCYGRSKRQIKQSSAALIEEIENRYANSVLLVYKGYIYIFSKDHKLITVYRNNCIPL